MDELQGLIDLNRLPPAFARTIDVAYRPIARRIAETRARAGRAIVVGICGAQGSGKSTLAAFVAVLLRQAGLSACVLALDDLYLPAEARAELARTAHPLLRTRGVPGTHEVALGVRLLEALTRPAPPHDLALPRFDKASDTRAPKADWPTVRAPVDVVLFEGWCVGARPEAPAALDAAVNALEREQDRDGRWRRYVNAQLAGDYRRLFAPIDLLVMLQAPAFERVFAWRALQERKLAEDAAGPARHLMGDDELRAFIMHYERLTRHILAEMPARADILVRLDDDQSVAAVEMRDDDEAGGVVRALDHVQLAMPPGREAEARAFYQGLLGIPEQAKPPNLARRGGCWFVRGELKLHLGVEADFRPAKKAHPALRVHDLPALRARLAAAGCRLVEDEPLDGYDRAYVDDPFGNRIELMEPLG